MRKVAYVLALIATGCLVASPAWATCRAARARGKAVVVNNKAVIVKKVVEKVFVAVPVIPVIQFYGAAYVEQPVSVAVRETITRTTATATTVGARRAVTVPGGGAGVAATATEATGEASVLTILKEIRAEQLTQRADIAALKAHTRLGAGATVAPAPASGTSGKEAPESEAKAPAPTPEVVVAAFEQMAKINCAICHSTANAPSFGGPTKFTLYEQYLPPQDPKGPPQGKQDRIRRFSDTELLSLASQITTDAMPKITARSKAAGIKSLSDEGVAVVQAFVNLQAKLNREERKAPPMPKAKE